MEEQYVNQSLPDHEGDIYGSVLQSLHNVLRPKSYFEIGVASGLTLSFSQCETIAVDPLFQFESDGAGLIKNIFNKAALHLYQMPSDEFFATRSPTAIFGRPIDMAFLDGMHRCEFLFRDFINTEKHCRPNSVVALHDCLPMELPMTARRSGIEKSIIPSRAGAWTGDVWRTALLLRRKRPDLSIISLDSRPTGLILITGLNPQDDTLLTNYRSFVTEMMSYDLNIIGIQNYFDEMEVSPVRSVMGSEDLINRHFWL